MPSFGETLRALNEMKAEGVVEEYAVAGAMALLFWIEPIPTFDLDVLVFLPPSGVIVSLDPIYRWAERRGWPVEKEHVRIAGVPVQFLPSPNELTDEAIERAETLEYGGTPVRVVRPEYLVALFLQGSARTSKRRERAAALRESGKVDEAVLQDLAKRFRIPL
jgi:hypothetical protein